MVVDVAGGVIMLAIADYIDGGFFIDVFNGFDRYFKNGGRLPEQGFLNRFFNFPGLPVKKKTSWRSHFKNRFKHLCFSGLQCQTKNRKLRAKLEH